MIRMKAPAPASLPAAAGSNEYDLQSCALKSRRASKLPAAALLAEFDSTLGRDRGTTVDLLIQMGEIEARKLYVGLSCASMYAYCTERLHMCEGTACRRIAAACAARRLPCMLPMRADGALHLSAVSALAPHLTPQNARALLAGATHKSKAEVERLLARHFPKPDVATAVQPLAEAISAASMAAQVVANMAQSPPPVAVVPMLCDESAPVKGPLPVSEEARSLHRVVSQVVAAAASNGCAESAPEALFADIASAVTQTIVNAAASVATESAAQAEPRARVTPRSAGRYAWRLTADQEMQELLDEAQELIGHSARLDMA